MSDNVIPIATAEGLLREFTARSWEYDAMACAICDGPVDWSVLSGADGDEHDEWVFEHKPDCLWVRAHRIVGRDLGPHTVVSE